MTEDIRDDIDIASLDWALPEMCGDNAMNWSRAFCATCVNRGIDLGPDAKGWMVGWFANAIETACNVRERQRRSNVDRTESNPSA